MNMLLRASLAVALVLSTAVDRVDAESSCGSLKQIASVATETAPDGRVSVPVAIGTQSLNFMLETQEPESLIRASSASALALPREPILAWYVYDGVRLEELAVVDGMKFGDLTANFKLAVAPDSGFEPGISGILADDFLRAFDVDFDFAKSRVNLFSPDHCQGGVVYWTKDGASRIPMELSDWGEITVDAELDGKSVRAEIATGLAKSYLLMATGNTKFGEPDKDWKLVKAGEYHNKERSAAVYEHVFKSLTFGGIEVDNADVTIRAGGDVLGARLFLGMDILRQIHLYIAYKERNLYVSAASAH
ncbi:MAG: hypothetical protein ACREHV_03030 [Rhizomicrobium sp.]